MAKGDMMHSQLSLTEVEGLTYGALDAATMGNASPAEVVPANGDRRGLIVCNTSDTTGCFAFDDSTGLTVTVYAFSLAAGASRFFAGPTGISLGALYAVCGSASKDIAYQEAT